MERGAQLGIGPHHCGPEHQIHRLFRIETGIPSFPIIIYPRNTLDVDTAPQYGDRLVLDLQFTISKLNGHQWRTYYLS